MKRKLAPRLLQGPPKPSGDLLMPNAGSRQLIGYPQGWEAVVDFAAQNRIG